MAKRKNRSLQIQKIAVGTAAVVILGLLGYFFSTSIIQSPKSKDYQLVDNPGQMHGNKVQVVEFFSYACPHCYKFDPGLNRWIAANKDRIDFMRIPAIGNTEWRMFARAYYAMQTLGILKEDHEKLFNAIHGVGLDLGTPDKLAAWFNGNGTTTAAFKSMMDSAGVSDEIDRAGEMQQRFKISGVPSVVIDSKYLVEASTEVGPSRMLKIMTYLVNKELSGKTPKPAGPPQAK